MILYRFEVDYTVPGKMGSKNYVTAVAATDAAHARVEVVDQYVVIRETYEFPIAGEWTRDRREFSKCEIRIHVPAGSIAQGEYDIS